MAKAKNRLRVKNQQFIDSAIVNDETYFDYLERFKRIALSMFEWVNLPESMNSLFLEKCLYYLGSAAFLKDSTIGFINTKACDRGNLNFYDQPTEVTCYSYGVNEYKKNYLGFNLLEDQKPEDFCILVMNNWDRYPTAYSMELFSYRLYELERTIDVNVKAQKTPVVITVDENQRLMMTNLFNQYDGNQPFIFGDKNQLKDGVIKALKTDAPYVVDKLQKQKQEVFNEVLTFLGINNIAAEKRERLNTEEATENNELINFNLESMLAPRKEACKLFNKLFNLEGDKAIDVKVRSDLFNIIKQEESIITGYDKDPEDEEVKDNG